MTRAGAPAAADAAPAAGEQRGDGGSNRGGGSSSARDARSGVRRPGSDPEKFGGLAKVNVSTGELTRIYEGRAPGNGATLATAGNLVFWGDIARKFRAFDADNGKILWETTLNGPIQNSTISYRVNGKQYVAVITGMGGMTQSLYERSGIDRNQPRASAIHVFALPN
jgi:alcohol dehydrogenase (cytochrome c)